MFPDLRHPESTITNLAIIDQEITDTLSDSIDCILTTLRQQNDHTLATSIDLRHLTPSEKHRPHPSVASSASSSLVRFGRGRGRPSSVSRSFCGRRRGGRGREKGKRPQSSSDEDGGRERSGKGGGSSTREESERASERTNAMASPPSLSPFPCLFVLHLASKNSLPPSLAPLPPSLSPIPIPLPNRPPFTSSCASCRCY